jgi:hypothetical protein
MRTRNGVIAVAVLSAVAFAGSIRAEHQVAVHVARVPAAPSGRDPP